MKAAIFHGPEKISVQNIAVPQINEFEVLVRIRVSGVCGTDVRIFVGEKTKGIRPDSVIGHEMVGIVEQAGSRVSGFAKGDRVGIMPVIPCLKCHYCLNGRENACANRKAIGYEFDGGFAEYVKIPQIALEAGNLVKLPNHVPFEQAVIAEPLACCINGNRKANIRMNDTVVVIGGGPIGLMHVQLAKISGARKVIVSELLEHRLGRALTAGADIVVNPQRQSLRDVVMQETEGLGADAVIMAIGVPSIVQECIELLRKGGTINLFAGFPKEAGCEIDPNFIHYQEVQVNGTTALTRSDYLTALSLIASGKINTGVLTTPGYTLDQIREAILDVKSGKGMKSIIHM
ncbi:zinc-dependent dehydrogenase [Paenibacillus hamazuiensis]|uniref:zinc-dependent dehydrogenase n=1 Tax=Paenibacillus hamazuiensis TaxID=2936508 RepID=UPI00200C31D6|nr:zinc-dependent dehydrogenase [Paenibacillus hamazuiensis]